MPVRDLADMEALKVYPPGWVGGQLLQSLTPGSPCQHGTLPVTLPAWAEGDLG